MSIEVVAGKSVSELDQLIAAAEAEKASAKERAVSEFQAKVDEVKALAESLGIKKITGYFGVPKAEKCYRDPNNAENTWSGKGPKPAWLKALLDGKSKDEAKEAMKAYLVA